MRKNSWEKILDSAEKKSRKKKCFRVEASSVWIDVDAYDDVTYVYDDVTDAYDDVTYVYDDVTYHCLDRR